eukprot:g14754.t1
MHGQADAVRELLQQVGIEGCGGESGGVDALFKATAHLSAACVDVMAALTDAGVVDKDGIAPRAATGTGNVMAVKFLLQEQQPKEAQEECGGREANEEELFRVEAIRRLLMSVDAIHAASRPQPPTELPAIAAGASIIDGGADDARCTKKAPTAGAPLSLTLPILRRGARQRDVLLPPLFSGALGRNNRRC